MPWLRYKHHFNLTPSARQAPTLQKRGKISETASIMPSDPAALNDLKVLNAHLS
jgi:hypothetical protein